jgi:hypothetical protein
MKQDCISLIDQLNGVIAVAHLAWQLPSTRSADLARTFRLVAHAFQITALSQRLGQPMLLRKARRYIAK